MSPRHHPDEDLLNGYASGALRPGAALAVRAHMAFCTACRAEIGRLEAVGGALLEAEPGADMDAEALATTLAALDLPAKDERFTAIRQRRAAHDLDALPPELRGLSLGRRRWVGPGVHVTPIREARESRELVYLLRIGRGMVLPRHTHDGSEFTCVLQGAFSDGPDTYRPGDFVEATDEIEHRPVVGAEDACVCLVSTDAPLVIRDLIGRLVQPLAGI